MRVWSNGEKCNSVGDYSKCEVSRHKVTTKEADNAEYTVPEMVNISLTPPVLVEDIEVEVGLDVDMTIVLFAG